MCLSLLRVYFYFIFYFQLTDSLEPCVKQPQSFLKSQKIEIKFNLEIHVFIGNPTNTPGVFHVETTWKRSFSRCFNVEYTWFVCREATKLTSL